ncbi:hypoxanthine phosphoribosyltransferase [Mahella sp.]|uniref:hypoxanthine phosphoribosyltransferase n=1 Tax=Mahella sp. TaxID=2798721 RepID=UPI0025C2DE9F|nr:hypoxanthine phosphoribosyltransferase [Mahella sp.]MBZ4666371.1 hypoxanthine phosphoribosyltransferase [Mahella sp.]
MEEILERVLLDEEQIKKRIRELGRDITEDYKNKDLLMIGVLKGAIVFFSDLIRAIDLPLTTDFIAVSSYGSSTKSSGIVRILKDLDESVEGKDILIVEDIIDTGLTLHYLVDNIITRNPSSVKICCLLDKPDKRLTEVDVDYIGFTIPDEFVVGYGLDYNERYRNLPNISVLRLEQGY